MRRSFSIPDHLIRLLIVAVAALLGIHTPLRGVATPGETLTGRPEIVDGDSLRLSGRNLRLAGLDAPELSQECERQGRTYPCGREARRALASLVGGADISCNVKGTDRYHRALATCLRDGRDIGAELVASGHALAYGNYTTQEAKARSSRLGVWNGTIERPEDWRRRHPRVEN